MRDSMAMSDSSSVMVRESQFNAPDKESMYDALNPSKKTRVVDNTKLSALTNQIMELVLDNIKMLHMNKKLLDYAKRQSIQSSAEVKLMEHTSTRAEIAKTTLAQESEQSNEKITQMKTELEEQIVKVRKIYCCLFGYILPSYVFNILDCGLKF